MRNVLIASQMVLAIAFTGPASAAGLATLWRTDGFATPESVLPDPANGRLIVSNINGSPMEADGNGFLSLLSPDGSMIEARWVEGMDAPKGMALSGGRLYVTDIDKIRVVDPVAGELVETLPVDGAQFLNDATTAADGSVFISDMLGNAIYRVSGSTVEKWLEDPGLDMPNGVLAEDGRLVVGSWGAGMKPDFSTDKPGGLHSIDLASKAIAGIEGGGGIGNMDGIVRVGEDLFMTDYMKGVLYRLGASGAVETAATLSPGSADIGAQDDVIYVPMMNDNAVVALSAAR